MNPDNPCSSGRQFAPSPSGLAQSRLSPAATPRILIIDDNPSIHRDFDLVLVDEAANPELDADQLRVFGVASLPKQSAPTYQIEHALSGLEGIEKVRLSLQQESPYQLAFVDIRMPGIDGLETIKRIWQLDPRMQIVICTAYADYSQEDLTQRLGFTDKLLVLKKPFDSIEVTQLALTLTEKWHLAIRAELKLEQMELLVAQRTQRVLELQQRNGGNSSALPNSSAEASLSAGLDKPSPEAELPVLLLVDSDGALRAQVQQTLGNDFRVLEAKAAYEGLAQARESVPDVILVSLSSLGVDGLELCRQLKADELASHIPIILLTGLDSEKQPLQALNAGADDCFAPSAALLRERVNSLVQSRQKSQRSFSPELTLHPREIAATQIDAQFLRRAIDAVEKHMSDFEFDVEALSRVLFMSRRQLFRKLKGVAGCAPNVFIRDLRLKRAAQLLKESRMTVTEITYAVGFSDLKHFRTIFKEHFGVLPGDFAEPGKEIREN